MRLPISELNSTINFCLAQFSKIWRITGQWSGVPVFNALGSRWALNRKFRIAKFSTKKLETALYGML